MLEGAQRMGASLGGCSLCDLAVRTLEAVDGKTDEISYRFPIVNARKLSPSSLSLSLSLPRIGLSFSLVFFFTRHCTESSSETVNARGSTSS